MSLLQSIFLGFVQGITEFLPVSSSGHLAIFKNFFGMGDVGMAFDILLHLGTLIAVFVVYWKDIVKIFFNGIGIIVDACYNLSVFVQRKKGQKIAYRRVVGTAYRKFTMLVIVSTIPTGVIAVLTKNITEAVGKSLIVPGICLLITGVLLLICDLLPGGNKTPKGTTYGNALLIGAVQGIATLPGISRSGSTITAAVACGLRRDFAVKYSFIMSIPAILGAVVLDIPDLAHEATGFGQLMNYFAGTIVAGFVGYICIKTMLVIVKNKKFNYFAYYCFLIGIISIIGYFVL